MEFKNWHNTTPSKGQGNFDPSQTVEGESYTIAELFHRNANGLLTNKNNGAFYPKAADYNDIDVDEVARMDILDKAEVLFNASANITAAKAAIDEAKAKRDAEESAKATTQGEASAEPEA